ncbi:MAG: MSMEG_0567/Sll0786 family nitrogen starvation N-acetyltransferase, partial [Mycobacterium sp.]
MTDNLLISLLSGQIATPQQDYLITPADSQPDSIAQEYAALRRHIFVDQQGLFAGTDRDDADDDPATTVLVATDPDGNLLGGVRLAPAHSPDVGWWTGSRLVLSPHVRGSGVGQALVRAACAWADANGVLRFDATVQQRYAALFTALGWVTLGDTDFAGVPHIRMQWPNDRFDRQVNATKAILADVLGPLTHQPLGLGPAQFRGDDGVPVGDPAAG